MKTFHRHPSRIAAAALASLLAGCASSTGFHYSELVGKRYFKTNIDTYPVLILSVDGRSIVGTPIQVDAGERSVLLQGPPTTVDLQLTQTMKLDVKPCTRYYLVAVKQSPLQNEFTPRVDFEEPMPGCTSAPAKQG
ncbi:MAG TPA: hypothetical protein PKC97_09150 [Burkholderiaceae bacterium]|nr:hypothetical protein [Burkholderiaceae bacterium]